MRRRVITALWVAVVSTSVTAVGLRLSGVVHGDTLDFVVGLAGLSISFSTLGALILIRRQGNRIGLLFMALAATEAVVVVMRLWATSLPPASKLGGTIGLVEEALRIAGLSGAGVTILLFPTGRLLSPRWRVVIWVFAVLTVIGSVSNVLVPGVIDGLPPVQSPWATDATATIAHALAPAGGLVGIAFLAAAASLIVRYRRAGRAEREQIKLFAIAVVSVVVLIATLTVALPKQMNGLLGSLVWQLPFILPPAAIGYAILRRGLFDIDRVISRTLSYAAVTVTLGGTFVFVVLVPTAVMGAGGKTPEWLVAVATLTVAALFRPVRRRVQSAVDHRFNRRRYDAEKTIDAFSARLRDEIDIGELTSDLQTLVHQTMEPAHVSIWLRG